MLDSIVRPFRRMAEDGWTLDSFRNAMWESYDPNRVVLAGAFLFFMYRRAMKHAQKYDWSDVGPFRQIKQPVKDRWGPPPPRRYDDDGNLINR
jgi:hypothetical protein